VRAVADRDEYVSAPFGCYYAGAGFLHFFYEPTLCGTVFWGRPDSADVEAFSYVVNAELPEHSPPHQALVDTRRLTSIDEKAFAQLSAVLGERAEAYGVNVLQQAMVRPEGVIGALVAGFYDVTPAVNRERSRMFVDMDEALAWLGRHAAVKAEIDAAQAAACGLPTTARSLRDWVRRRPEKLTLEVAARALGLSPRSLQAELSREGSNFRRELNLARIEVAKELLAGSDTKLGAIALEVGCGSLPHFSALFRKLAGCSPSEYRQRHRR
jgi:AraC-like DNA-binding protein